METYTASQLACTSHILGASYHLSGFVNTVEHDTSEWHVAGIHFVFFLMVILAQFTFLKLRMY